MRNLLSLADPGLAFTVQDILEHIVYDLTDTHMMESLRPTIEDAQPIQSQQMALDYLGKRGTGVGVLKAKRIEYARELLEKELLPHIGMGPGLDFQIKKAYFIGYMVHRLLLLVLGRRYVGWCLGGQGFPGRALTQQVR